MNYNGYDSYGSSSQSIGQHGEHNHSGQHGEHNHSGQTNQVAWGQYTYPDGQNNPGNIYDHLNFYSHQADHPIGFGGQHNLKMGEMPSSGHTHMVEEYINEMTSKMEVVLKEFLQTSNDLFVQGLLRISSRLSQRAEGQTLNPNLISQSQEELGHPFHLLL
ncbi:hypothetical protein Pyn_36801 [Prunus yedoensis var. nudiflora]|uniref:Uncharacterized protein n=1 Tax=Prunus yedoensis var. nudiflora TaxID=2094558 RepID=A0A314XV15_PRUYE|nr:hypothetical protein Pyn_36801 [Prunus yedoensis var. nudiflora]